MSKGTIMARVRDSVIIPTRTPLKRLAFFVRRRDRPTGAARTRMSQRTVADAKVKRDIVL